MNEQRLRTVDLNLLLAFAVLMRERSVSRAATRLGIGQPGMSAMLARLRGLLDDQVLVRVGRSFEPTPRALALVAPVEAALDAVEHTLFDAAPFDPARLNRALSLGLPDSHEIAFVPSIARRLRHEAPHALLVVRSADRTTASALLDAGEIDLAIAVAPNPAAWHVREPLFPQGYACLFAPERLDLPVPVSLDDYCRHPHVLVSFKGDRTGTVDRALAAVGRQRRVAVAVPRFATVPVLLKEVPLLATMPTAIARHLAATYGLACSPVPVEVAPRRVALLWRRRDADDPVQGWWRTLVREVVAERASGGAGAG